MTLSDSTLAPAPDASASARPLEDEVLYQNERTLVMRRRLADGRAVIVKRTLGANGQTQMRHEASILARLVGVHGVVQLTPEQRDGELIFVDEQAEPLAKRLINDKLSVAEQVQLAIELAQILSQLHKAGVIHKDINPSNILLRGAGQQPMLIDFNIASCFAHERKPHQYFLTAHQDI